MAATDRGGTQEDEQSGISRRRVIQGAVAGGVLVWSAPVIDSIVSRAAAASPVGIGGAPFSELAVELVCGDAVYNVKYGSPTFNYTDGKGACGTFAVGGCDPFLLTPTTSSCPSNGQLSQQATFNAALTQMSIVVGDGCQITKFAIHQGSCCCGTGQSSTPCSETQPTMPFAGPATATFNKIGNKSGTC